MFAHLPRRHRGGLPLAGLLVMLPTLAMAQAALPVDPMIGQYQRSVRNLQDQAATDPAGAARGASQVRRQFINQNGGVGFDRDRALVDRQLRDLEQGTGLQQVPPPATQPGPASQPLANPRLPSSYADDPSSLPSIQREMQLVGRLLDRAEGGIADRNAEQVSSDLATAESSVAALLTAVPPAEVKPLADRLAGLRQQLAALPPGETGISQIDRDLMNLDRSGERATPGG